MIKFRCECTKKIGVPDAYAGRHVKCPSCGSPVRVPELVEESVAPQPVQVQEQIVQNEDEHLDENSFFNETSDVPDSIWSDDVFNLTPAPTNVKQRPCPNCGTSIDASIEACPACRMMVDPVGDEQDFDDSDIEDREEKQIVSEKGPKKQSYFRDMIYVFTPVHSLDDGILLFFAILVSLVRVLVDFIPFIPGISLLSYMATSYLFVYYFTVLLHTANGEKDLPELPINDRAEMFVSFIRFIVSYLYACLIPVGIVFLFAGDVFSDDGAERFLSALRIGTLIGLFLWPMIILSISLNQSVFIRPDKVFLSIIRTAGPYSICVVMMYLAVFLNYYAPDQVVSTIGVDHIIIMIFVFNIVGLVSMLTSMRIIGVYYKHNSEKIDW